MKIIALADIHGDTGRIGEMGVELASVDVVLLPGGLTDFGGEDTVFAEIEEGNVRAEIRQLK